MDDLKRGYIYSIWSGILRKYEGTISGTFDGGKTSLFIASNNKKRYLCSIEPEEVYNGMVWLSEENDELAISILVEYEECAIDALKERIDNHRSKINTLLKGVNANVK